jgi:hypothetical protein
LCCQQVQRSKGRRVCEHDSWRIAASRYRCEVPTNQGRITTDLSGDVHGGIVGLRYGVWNYDDHRLRKSIHFLEEIERMSAGTSSVSGLVGGEETTDIQFVTKKRPVKMSDSWEENENNRSSLLTVTPR